MLYLSYLLTHRYLAGYALEIAPVHQKSWATRHVPQLFPFVSHRASPSHKQTLTGSHTIKPSSISLASFRRKLFCLLSNRCCHVPVTKQKMACPQVTPPWVPRVQASHCTLPSPRAREESPSSTALTRTTTCHPRRSRGTPPSPAKGES